MWPPAMGVWTIISPRHAIIEYTTEPMPAVSGVLVGAN